MPRSAQDLERRQLWPSLWVLNWAVWPGLNFQMAVAADGKGKVRGHRVLDDLQAEMVVGTGRLAADGDPASAALVVHNPNQLKAQTLLGRRRPGEDISI